LQLELFHGGRGGVESITQENRIPQTWVVGDVDHCVAELTAFIREFGVTDLVTWGVPPGMRPDQMHAERVDGFNPLAVIDAATITAQRTAAISGVAIRQSPSSCTMAGALAEPQ